MPNSEVKETLCNRCAHREICIYKQDYINILKAIENATVTQDTPDGITSKKVIHYDFISGISVSCKYYSCKWSKENPREALHSELITGKLKGEENECTVR